MNRIVLKENRNFIFDNPKIVGFRLLKTSCLCFLCNVYYKILFGIRRPEKKSNYDYNVSICAIFKNESPYLKEWIEFHNLVGVEHFYLYNNNSNDNYKKVLKPYIDNGLVTLCDWPYENKQMECYIRCIEQFSSETKWIGFIDIDEFVVPKSVDCIYDFLKKFERKRGSVLIYWKLFGSSGLIERDMNGLVIEDFTLCWPKYCDIGKCFYNTTFDFNPNSKHIVHLHHDFWSNWKGIDLPPVNIFDKICFRAKHSARTNSFPIQINHYFTKSYEEYEMKKSKGDVYFQINPHDEEYFYEHEMKCTSNDYSAYKYLIKLKLLMRKAYNECC